MPGKRFLVMWLGLVYCTNAQEFQSCLSITIDDLGSTTEFSSDGLVPRAIVSQGETVPKVPVKIRNFATVCDASGNRTDTSSFISVVVEFQCDFEGVTSQLTVCSDPNNVVIRQYQFHCIEVDGQPVLGTSVSGSNLFIQTLDPTATLSTPLANQCRRCIDDEQTNRPSIDPTTHCDREPLKLFCYCRPFYVIQSQHVHQDVTGDRGVAILGQKLMFAVTSTYKETAYLIAQVLWCLILTLPSIVVSVQVVSFTMP